MALSQDLAKIANKGAGTYLQEYDRSNVPNSVPASEMRILIGQSRNMSTVNNPVLIDSPDTKSALIGDIDLREERLGSFGSRFADIMLEAGPFLYLNLRDFDDTLDKADYVELSTSGEKSNGVPTKKPYEDFYNTQGFWYIDPEKLVLSDNTDKLITLGNVGNKKLSVFIRKSTVSDYNITFKTWYQKKSKDIPPYLYELDYVRDYMIDVYIFGTDFSDLDKASTHPVYGYLFDVNDGLKKTTVDDNGDETDGLTELLSITDSRYIGVYTGTMLPGFEDLQGNDLYIPNLINSDSSVTGVIAEVNQEVFDEAIIWQPEVDGAGSPIYASNGGKQPIAIDMLQHTLCNIDSNGALDEVAYEAYDLNLLSYNKTDLNIKTADYDTLDLDADFSDATLIKLDNLIVPGTETEVAGDYVYDIQSKTKAYLINVENIRVGQKYVSKDGNLATLVTNTFVGEKTFLIGLHTSRLPLQGVSGGFTEGEVFPTDNGVFVYPVGHANVGETVEYDIVTDAPLDAPGGTAIPFPTQTEQQYATILAEYGQLHNIFECEFDKEILTGYTSSVTSVGAKDPQYTLTLDDSTEIIVFKDSLSLYRAKNIDDISTHYLPIKLDNYIARDAQFVNGTEDRMDEILNVLISGGIYKAMKNKDRISYKYIVDGFRTYVNSSVKSQLFKMAADRQMVTTIASMPFTKDFIESTNPYFRTTTGGDFEPKYINSGGNLDLPHKNIFSLPTYGDTQGGFFGGGMYHTVNSYTQTIPSAAAVSNAFIYKLRNGSAWDIAAGNPNGVISFNGFGGMDYDWQDDDRDYLEPFGYNSIVFKNAGGYQIFSNRTAQNDVTTSLSSLHVRELLNYLEERIFYVLQSFTFKFNTPANRARIKTEADSICRNALNGGGLIYFDNQINAANNDSDVLNARMGILDTRIVAGQGMEKTLNRMYIYPDRQTAESEILTGEAAG